MRKVLFIDRDGTLAIEPKGYQLDAFEKLEFYPEVFTYLGKIAKELEYNLVMVTNQDGLGTPSFPEETFWPIHNFIIQSFKNEGVVFDEVFIDKSFPVDNAPTRKPRTGMFTHYMNTNTFDLKNSFVIGDRITDMELANNLGCQGIFIANDTALGAEESSPEAQNAIVFSTTAWKEIYTYLKLQPRKTSYQRKTNETQINIEISLEGTGKSKIDTGLPFFDHMLDQLA
ncbi:MAG: histidinol-phosphatase, partial [Flavobacteriaceae bacterium]